MAAPANASGTIAYWIDGRPLGALQISGQDPGTMKYWVDGRPALGLWPSGAVAATPPKMTLMGVGP